MTRVEAAKAVGVRLFVLEGRIIDAGWAAKVGRREIVTLPAGVSGGYLSPIIDHRQTLGGTIAVETGFTVTARGVAALRAGAGAP